MGSLTLISGLWHRPSGSTLAPEAQTRGRCFPIPGHGRWHISGPSFTQAGQCCWSGSIPSLLLWFPSAPLWGKTSPLLTRFPFLVFEHGCDNNCIIVLFLVIFVCFEKVLAKCSIIINFGSKPPISLILSFVFTNAFYLALVYSR